MSDPPSYSLFVLDGSTNAVVATVPVGSYPAGIAVNPTKNKIYVTYAWTHSLLVVNATSNSIVASIPVGLTSFGVAINSVTNRIYVTDLSSDSLLVLDASSNNLIANVSVIFSFCCSSQREHKHGLRDRSWIWFTRRNQWLN